MAAAIGLTLITGSVITLPTIVLIGSFLVPVTGVVWYLDHDPSLALSPRRITAAFIIAGTLGVLAASLLEYYLVGTGALANLEVGLIEELVKTLLVVAVAWGIHAFHTRDGMVLDSVVVTELVAVSWPPSVMECGRPLSAVQSSPQRGVTACGTSGSWARTFSSRFFTAASIRSTESRLCRGVDDRAGPAGLAVAPGGWPRWRSPSRVINR